VKRLCLALLFLSGAAFATGPTLVGGAVLQCVSGPNCSPSYTPTSTLNEVIVCGTSNGAVTSMSAADTLGTPVSLNAGPQVLTSPASGIFYYTPGAGVTGFKISFGTSHAMTVAVAEYSNVTSVVGTPTGGTNNATSNNPNVSPTASESGDLAVACLARLGAGSAQTAAGSSSLREEAHTTAPSGALADTTASGATSTEVQTSVGSAAWTASALILKTAGGGGPTFTPRLTMLGVGP
jgi:hypothetical protein